MSLRGTAALALLATVGALACSQTSAPLALVYHPTLIEVSPDQFLGPVPCANAAGAMRSYVATVFDVEYEPDGSRVMAGAEPTDTGAGGAAPDETSAGGSSDGDVAAGALSCPADASRGTTARSTVGFALPSSAAIDCRAPVAFSRVVDGNRYRAVIEGYDRPLDELVPLAAGVPILYDASTGEVVPPRWTFHCGDACPEVAAISRMRAVSDCELVSDPSSLPSGPATVEVALPPPVSTRGETAPSCGSHAGQIDHFEVTRDDDSAPPVTAACSGVATLADVPTGRTLVLSVVAYGAGSSQAAWGTKCMVLPMPGLTVQATCAPLTNQGGLTLAPSGALASLGASCDELSSLGGELELQLLDDSGSPVGQPHFVVPADCARPVLFSNVPFGPARVTATLRSGPDALGSAACDGTVVPAHTASATCSMEP